MQAQGRGCAEIDFRRREKGRNSFVSWDGGHGGHGGHSGHIHGTNIGLVDRSSARRQTTSPKRAKRDRLWKEWNRLKENSFGQSNSDVSIPNSLSRARQMVFFFLSNIKSWALVRPVNEAIVVRRHFVVTLTEEIEVWHSSSQKDSAEF